MDFRPEKTMSSMSNAEALSQAHELVKIHNCDPGARKWVVRVYVPKVDQWIREREYRDFREAQCAAKCLEVHIALNLMGHRMVPIYQIKELIQNDDVKTEDLLLAALAEEAYPF